ncbi:MAG: hypothetical protein COC10_09335 [Sphingobium sp.]|jgi:hypothetical protein|nr:MAG: hypothetical protein COC10_09335 [Sphingobium sp.]
MSPADRFREAREAFELAMKLGCTPREAARAFPRRRGACGRRVESRQAMPVADDDVADMAAPPTNFSAWTCQHMMRD